MIIFDFNRCEIINLESSSFATGMGHVFQRAIGKPSTSQKFTITVNNLYYKYLFNWMENIKEGHIKLPLQYKRELYIADSYNDLVTGYNRFNLLGCFITQMEIPKEKIDIEVTIKYDYLNQNDKDLKQFLRDIKLNKILNN